jgi:hypothetical protein
VSVARAKTRDEKLFAAAVLRRSFELRGEEYADVKAYLAANRAAVEAAIGRKG